MVEHIPDPGAANPPGAPSSSGRPDQRMLGDDLSGTRRPPGLQLGSLSLPGSTARLPQIAESPPRPTLEPISSGAPATFMTFSPQSSRPTSEVYESPPASPYSQPVSDIPVEAGSVNANRLNSEAVSPRTEIPDLILPSGEPSNGTSSRVSSASTTQSHTPSHTPHEQSVPDAPRESRRHHTHHTFLGNIAHGLASHLHGSGSLLDQATTSVSEPATHKRSLLDRIVGSGESCHSNNGQTTRTSIGSLMAYSSGAVDNLSSDGTRYDSRDSRDSRESRHESRHNSRESRRDSRQSSKYETGSVSSGPAMEFLTPNVGESSESTLHERHGRHDRHDRYDRHDKHERSETPRHSSVVSSVLSAASSVASSAASHAVNAASHAHDRGRRASRALPLPRHLKHGLSRSPLPGSSRSQRMASISSSLQSDGSSSSQGSLRADSMPHAHLKRTFPLEESDKLRHVEIPSNPRAKKANLLVRVHRQDGTFGTLAASIDVTAEDLVRHAGRKFFLSNIEDYHLVIQYANRMLLLSPDDQPLAILQEELFHIGYAVTDRMLQGIGHHSYLSRLIVTNTAIMPIPVQIHEAFLRRPQRLFLHMTDVPEMPADILSVASKIKMVDISRSVPTLVTEEFSEAAVNLESLRLTEMFYRHVMPGWLNMFHNLTYLNLSRNSAGAIPLDFSNFPRLKSLNLSSNRLRTLPRGLEKLPLEYFKAQANYLTVLPALPESIREVDLSYNYISSFDPGVGRLVNLERLYMPFNLLESLPAELEKLEKLDLLDLRHNMLESFHIVELRGLHTLLLSDNLQPTRLSESSNSSNLTTRTVLSAQGVPDITPRLSNIRYLDLQNSRLRFLPGTSMNYMTVLNLTNSNLVSLPEEFFDKLLHLEKVVLDKNWLTRLPSSIGVLTHLTHLSVSKNTLTSLPPEFCELFALEYLDIHSNNLSLLPAEFWKLSGLMYLNISSNLFETLPKFLGLLSKEQFDQARLHPQSLIETRRESAVSITSDRSVGSISESGSVASSVANTPRASSAAAIHHYGCGLQLRELWAADNRLNEECFEDVAKLTNLAILNLSYNEISEIPPRVLREVPSLQELYLAGNRLSSLPQDDLEYLPNLRTLYLNSNRFHSLPAELAQLKELVTLDVSANNLRYNVSNWPFDWNWRWNQKLEYLNLSSNRRLEIRRAIKGRGEDLTDFAVLKNLKTLSLIDVTLILPSVPDQNESCRVRTYGSDLHGVRVGIADVLGESQLSINDLVMDRFRGNSDEVLVGMFDGIVDPPTGGNKISKVMQEIIPLLFKEQLEQLKDGEHMSDALRRAFLAAHREIGNTAYLPVQEVSHSFLGQHNSTAAHLTAADRSSGTGAALAYFKDRTLHLATMGGTQCVVSKANGDYKILNEPHLSTVASEREFALAAGTQITDGKIGGVSKYTRAIGCYDLEIGLFRAPSIYEYQLSDPTDMVIMASPEFWEYVSFETAADIVRTESNDPMFAALKLRDLAIAHGCRSRCMVMVVGNQERFGAADASTDAAKRRRNPLPLDTSLARLGSEAPAPQGDIAVVFTDIRNSTTLWETMPTIMRSAIKTHNAIMRRSIRLMGGYEVKTEGDAFIVAFQTSVQALLWCVTVQRQILTAEWPDELLALDECGAKHAPDGSLVFRGLRVRMGIHWGRPVYELDPITGRMDYFGPVVNRAARISAIALGGQIAVSHDLLSAVKFLEAAHERVATEGLEEAYGLDTEKATELDKRVVTLIAEGYVSVEVGELKLKGIENPEFIYIIYPGPLKNRASFDFNAEDPSISISGLSQSQTPRGPPHPMEVVGWQDSEPYPGVPVQAPLVLQEVCNRLEQLCETAASNGENGLAVPTHGASVGFHDPAAQLAAYITRVENAIAALTLYHAGAGLDYSEILRRLTNKP